MSVTTTYDEMRIELKEKLNECLKLGKEMLNENIWGYEEMKKDYATDVFIAIKKARDII